VRSAEHVKRGHEWPQDIADDDESCFGGDWNFLFHRMLADAVDAILAA
jgi:hypothetical protein